MEREFFINGRKTLIEKTGRRPTINGVAHIEISVRRQILDEYDNLNGYDLIYRHVHARSTWKDIAAYLTPSRKKELDYLAA